MNSNFNTILRARRSTPGFPLDNLDQDPLLAISSNKKLFSDYEGDCLRLRRSSDNAEADFGFDGNEIDIDSINTWLSGSDAYIPTIYDQAGSSKDGSQPTLTDQAKFDTTNKVFEFDGVDDFFDHGNNFTFSGGADTAKFSFYFSFIYDGGKIHFGKMAAAGASDGEYYARISGQTLYLFLVDNLVARRYWALSISSISPQVGDEIKVIVTYNGDYTMDAYFTKDNVQWTAGSDPAYTDSGSYSDMSYTTDSFLFGLAYSGAFTESKMIDFLIFNKILNANSLNVLLKL